jgi:hypothetical protein
VQFPLPQPELLVAGARFKKIGVVDEVKVESGSFLRPSLLMYHT